jgi:hypothetical protein
LKSLVKKLSVAAAAIAAFTAVAVAPASPAAAADPVCTQSWQMKSIPTGTYINFVPRPAGTQPNSRFLADCELRRGNINAAVTGLQLTIVRCYGISISIDGNFGPGTQSAVRTVQGRIGVGVDGIFGPQTLMAMKWIQGSAANTNSTSCLGYHATGQSFSTLKRLDG